jgi:hypothetical protein
VYIGFRRSVLPPFSGLNNKRIMQPAGSKKFHQSISQNSLHLVEKCLHTTQHFPSATALPQERPSHHVYTSVAAIKTRRHPLIVNNNTTKPCTLSSVPFFLHTSPRKEPTILHCRLCRLLTLHFVTTSKFSSD